MNAPDKIYLHPDIGGKEFIRPWLKRAANSESVAYIRKDTLLKWAKSKKARLKQGYKHDWKNDDILHGGTLILDSLIDEIESL